MIISEERHKGDINNVLHKTASDFINHLPIPFMRLKVPLVVLALTNYLRNSENGPIL